MSLQKQYTGFLNTPFLWLNKLNNLQQFQVDLCNNTTITIGNKENIRLGKLVERFVSFTLQHDNSINILAENIQVQDEKITVGELDLLLVRNNIPIHLEIIYKFYLYDNTVGTNEIEHWIGPNRRDSLIQKLTKLKDKQLPLLYHEKTKPYLERINLSVTDIVQQVYFKAQLFVPLTDFGKVFPVINNDCIYGFYIYPKELHQFSDCKFYIPTKHNWLVEVAYHTDWMNFDSFQDKLAVFLSQKNAPLCWLKKSNGKLLKFFVIWW